MLLYCYTAGPETMQLLVAHGTSYSSYLFAVPVSFETVDCYLAVQPVDRSNHTCEAVHRPLRQTSAIICRFNYYGCGAVAKLREPKSLLGLGGCRDASA